MSWGIEFPFSEREKPHKPECEMAKECLPDGPHWPNNEEHDPRDMPDWCQVCDQRCICPSLRACYQRALDAAREAVAAVEDQWDAEIDYDRDYAFDPSGGTRNPRIWLRDALAAIDALRQEKK